MRKRFGTLGAATMIVLAFMLACSPVSVRPVSAAAAPAPTGDTVLLLYDSLALSTEREGNVETLERLLAAYGVPVAALSFDRYAEGMLKSYRRVAVVRNAPDLSIANAALVSDLASYGGDYLQVGGRELPDRVRARLNLTLDAAPLDTVRLEAGDYGQTLSAVADLDEIAGASGDAKTYGTLTFESDGTRSPYAVSAGGYAYASYLSGGSLAELALAYVLKDWLRITGDFNAYVLIKEIYPFSDLELLKTLADRLYEAGVPFAASVKPVFYNTDYPAMQRYIQALQYLQARNGSILVDAPAVAATSTVGDGSLRGKMSGFIELLAASGIAPLGMGAGLFWTYDEVYVSQGMSFFDTVFLGPNADGQRVRRTGASATFAFSPYVMPFAQLQDFERRGVAPRTPLPLNLAFSFDLFPDAAALEDAVGAISRSWIPFADLKNGTHAVHTDRLTIESSGGGLVIDGQPLDIGKQERAVEEDYAYTAEARTSFTKLFGIQNQILMVIIGTSLAVFGLFLFIGYRRYKRKYIYPGGRHDAL
ncbi:hypothetical protein [Cohnella sp. JJ-181]|uniref:hypothetical protein n=1 Tax=Cohnella rhizoplanae TaxID=2974897 RepID=UPI0022FF5D33|nr:hypothetical protein [Cohnella sp. JJ-181]CAI6081668.1 hypothetical protein COHCIP112018_03387 [Cohnella sp. JJ-181]